MIFETQEIIEQLQAEINRLSDLLIKKKDKKLQQTREYRMLQYKYQELKTAMFSVNNSRMCLLEDFRIKEGKAEISDYIPSDAISKPEH